MIAVENDMGLLPYLLYLFYNVRLYTACMILYDIAEIACPIPHYYKLSPPKNGQWPIASLSLSH